MQKMNRLIIMILAVTVTLTAYSPDDSLTVYEMRDSIVVVANRYEASIKNIAYSYQLVPREQIRDLAVHSALEVVDIHFPSAFLFEKKVMGYGVGTAGSGQLYLRGQGGQPNTGVLVLLNGHPDFMGIFGHPLPDVYGMDDIAQAEILAGPASTVFGSNAMGGVINLVTNPDYKTPVKFSAEAGSFNTYNVGINVNRRFSNSGAHFTLRRKYSEGHLDQTSFESYHFQGGWQYQLNPVWNLSVSGRYVPYQFDDPSRGNTDTLNIGGYGDIKRGTGEVKLENKSRSLNGSVQLYTNQGRHRFYDGFESTDFSYGFSVYQHWKAASTYSFAAGLDLIHYGGEAENKYAYLPNGQPSVNEEAQQLTTSGAYLLGFFNPFRMVHFKAGVRYQYNSLPIHSVAPVLGISINPRSDLSVYSNYQTGFRTPTLMNLYLFPSANEDLEEERISSVEIGSQYRFHGQNSIQVAVYRNDAQNLIQTLPNPSPPPLFLFQNSGEAIQYGLETKLRVYPMEQTGIQLSYSYLDPDDLTAFNPEQQFKYMLMTRWDRFHAILFGKYVSGIFAGNDKAMKLPDYNLLNLSFTYNFSDVDFKLKLKNLLDTDYDILPSYKAPGFHVMAGLTYRLTP